MDHGPRPQMAPTAVIVDIAPMPKVADEVGWHRLGAPDTRHVGVSDQSEEDGSRFSLQSCPRSSDETWAISGSSCLMCFPLTKKVRQQCEAECRADERTCQCANLAGGQQFRLQRQS